jgi:prepilin-type processing-associated H-X9-DG protein
MSGDPFSVLLLIAILLPALSKARERTRQIQCANNLRQGLMCLITYDQDMKEFPNGMWNIMTGMTKGHKAIEGGYGMSTAIVTCPSGDPPKTGARAWNVAADDSVMGYIYMAGEGNRPRSNWGVMGWDAGVFTMATRGYAPAKSVSRPYALNVTMVAPQLHPSRQFVMKDASYVALTTAPHSDMPQTPSHPRKGGRSALGSNISFLDGHVEWHNHNVSESWRFASLAHNSGYWSPKSSPPTGVTINYLSSLP